jgi:hypothetical protein
VAIPVSQKCRILEAWCILGIINTSKWSKSQVKWMSIE